MALKMQCLWAAEGDIDKAKKIYDFFAEDMKNLSDSEPEPTTWQASTVDTINGVVGWIRENQDVLTQGYEFIRSMMAGKNAAANAANALPPIN